MSGMIRMKRRHIILSFCLAFAAIPAMGQVLTDGISGRDRIERLMVIQAFSPESDTCMVMTDSLGRFEIDPYLMDGMRGNVYLKPMGGRPKPKLTIESPFDSIDVHRKGRERYLTQGHVAALESEEPVFHYDPETTLLKESVVRAKRHFVGRDKVTRTLDSLAILSCPEWECDCGGLNDYHGYSCHPVGSPMAANYTGKRNAPKRGKMYDLIKWEPVGPNGEWAITQMSEIIYPGPDYTEEDLLKMNGMWKTKGYFPKREFYQPDELDLASPTPDFRNILQWQPAVLTDENGMAEIPFAASDVNTEFIGLIEAVDGMGLLGCQTLTFRVIKD